MFAVFGLGEGAGVYLVLISRTTCVSGLESSSKNCYHIFFAVVWLSKIHNKSRPKVETCLHFSVSRPVRQTSLGRNKKKHISCQQGCLPSALEPDSEAPISSCAIITRRTSTLMPISLPESRVSEFCLGNSGCPREGMVSI